MELIAPLNPAVFMKELTKILTPNCPPISEVSVHNPWTNHTVLSEADGSYKVEGLEPGIYTVSARTPPVSTGEARLISLAINVRAVENHAIANLALYPSLVTIRGTVMDEDGQPLAGARVTGAPRPYPETFEIRVIDDVTTVTDALGRYELTGFPPVTCPYRIGGYLNGGSLRTQFDYSTYAEIHVKAEGYHQPQEQIRDVPLVTEAYLPAGRRFLETVTRLPKDKIQPIGEKADVYLPHSKGTVIDKIDIMLEND